jgi:hypothetical protein
MIGIDEIRVEFYGIGGETDADSKAGKIRCSL